MGHDVYSCDVNYSNDLYEAVDAEPRTIAWVGRVTGETIEVLSFAGDPGEIKNSWRGWADEVGDHPCDPSRPPTPECAQFQIANLDRWVEPEKYPMTHGRRQALRRAPLISRHAQGPNRYCLVLVHRRRGVDHGYVVSRLTMFEHFSSTSTKRRVSSPSSSQENTEPSGQLSQSKCPK